MFGHIDPHTLLPFAIDWSSLTSSLFLVNVGVLAGIYALLALGLQLNVGFTGITNFGQAGFMAIGGYTMAILTVDTGISFWLSLPLSMLAAMAFGLLVGLPSLRLRADYFAIATLVSSDAVWILALDLATVQRTDDRRLLAPAPVLPAPDAPEPPPPAPRVNVTLTPASAVPLASSTLTSSGCL